MKKSTIKTLLTTIFVTLLLSSCSSVNTSMREPNMLIEFDKSDFEMSEQLSAEATCKKILGIDWKHLFDSKAANVGASASIFGIQPLNTTAKSALYNMLSENPGYDVIFYPQYEINKKSYIVFSITTVKATAKLGKISE